MYEPYQQHLSRIREGGKYRRLTLLRQAEQKKYLNFSTNDYLELSRNVTILEAATAATREYGVGSGGSRLLAGNSALVEKFEERIARDKKCEGSLIFNTGFQANISALSALLDARVLGSKPIVFFDRNNHSSLYQAIFLATPTLVRYHHNNISHLADLLNKFKHETRPKFIVTETIFGMDGNIIPLEEIASLAQQHRAILYLDEAHATGIVGPSGYGLSTAVDLTNVACIIMGTFSKALGCSGGYIACSQIIKDYLLNRATGFIYSTAPSPLIMSAAFKAWELIRALHQQRKKLLDLSTCLREKLQQAGFNIGTSTTHIVPVILNDEPAVLAAQQRLYDKGVIVSAIRPPTVPVNSSRLRIALTTSHRAEDIEYLVKVLKEL